MNTPFAGRSGSAPGHLLAGGLAGLLATVPMTGAMLLMQRFLPPVQRRFLPPEQITVRVIADRGAFRHLREPARTLATGALHFGFGAGIGALYGLVARRGPGPAPARGAAYALAVWLTSYLGWLPALGILRPATDHPVQRNALMIVAHLIWGATTGVLVELLDSGDPVPQGAGPANQPVDPAPAQVPVAALAPAPAPAVQDTGASDGTGSEHGAEGPGAGPAEQPGEGPADAGPAEPTAG